MSNKNNDNISPARIILDIRRISAGTADTIQAQVVAASTADSLQADAAVKAAYAAEIAAGSTTRQLLDGDAVITLPAQINGVKNVVVDGYTIEGIPNFGCIPLQPYLLVSFDTLTHRNNDDVIVGRAGGNAKSQNESGMPLPIHSAPYTYRVYDQPSTREWFRAQEKNGKAIIDTLKIKVRGPDGETPLFSRLVLYLRSAVDSTFGPYSHLPVIAHGIDTENPAEWHTDIVGQPMYGV